jgi:ABC-type transporter MlaC component
VFARLPSRRRRSGVGRTARVAHRGAEIEGTPIEWRTGSARPMNAAKARLYLVRVFKVRPQAIAHSEVLSMSVRQAIAVSLAMSAFALALPTFAAEEDAQGFVQQQHRRIGGLLHQPVSSARDAQVRQALGAFVGYDDLTHRAFGQPCPAAEPSCEDLWAGYSESQRSEVRDLLEQLVRKTYERNLVKTLDYDVDYRGSRDALGDTRVMTEAKNRLKPREPAVRIDYVVKRTPEGFKVVDIITEGSSLTKNYYDQFRKKMHNPDEGYANIVQKLRDKIAKTD